jgi:hypothetical protein
LALLLGALDVATFLFLLLFTLVLPVDQSVRGFAWVIALLYALTGLPGLVLAALDRLPRIALGLAIAFPVLFVLFYIGVQIAAAM